MDFCFERVEDKYVDKLFRRANGVNNNNNNINR